MKNTSLKRARRRWLITGRKAGFNRLTGTNWLGFRFTVIFPVILERSMQPVLLLNSMRISNILLYFDDYAQSAIHVL